MSDLSAKVAELLEVLGSKLQGPAEEVFALYVRQMVCSGAATVIGWGLLVVVAPFCVLRGCRWARDAEGDFAGEVGAPALIIVSGIAVPVGLGCVIDGILHLLNPEFYALQALLKHLPG